MIIKSRLEEGKVVGKDLEKKKEEEENMTDIQYQSGKYVGP